MLSLAIYFEEVRIIVMYNSNTYAYYERDDEIYYSKYDNQNSISLSKETLIHNSFQRCKSYNLSRDSKFISPIPSAEEIIKSRRSYKELINVADRFIKSVLRTLEDEKLLIFITNPSAYILCIWGDKRLQEEYKQLNCFIGARWHESEIGTTAVSISIIERLPIQVTGEQHYCKRYHDYSCVAVPMITESGELLGCLSIFAKVSDMPSIALSMAVTMGQAIIKEIELLRTLGDLQFANRCQEAIIDSIFSGFMIIDSSGYIANINRQGAEIFGVDPSSSIGKHISEIVNSKPVVLDVMKTGIGWTDREFFIDTKRGLLRLIKTAIPVKNASGEIVYVIETFREMKKVHEFATKVMGASAHFTFDDIVGNSPAISRIKDLAASISESDSTVLITGETGTGKEVFAQAIHMGSKRSKSPYIAINCGCIPRDLLESELFGYVEGAFSGASKGGKAGKFELAAGGTILLDEIGEMPLDMQVKLLRVLQDRKIMRLGGNKIIPINARIIVATNKNLEEEVKSGNFREDLYYRLNVIKIDIPPLRARKEDIIILANHFIKKVSSRLRKSVFSISPDAMLALAKYPWPGNVRELENAIERAVNICHSDTIELCDLPENISNYDNNETGGIRVRKKDYSLEVVSLRDIELEILKQALYSNKGNVTLAAKQLGISRTTVYNKIKKYRLYNYSIYCKDSV